MTLRPLLVCAATLAAGYALAGGLYVALINVPESNVAALTLSVVLTVAIVLVLGVSTALAAVLPYEPWRQALRRSLRALPIFLLGALLFAGVFFAAGRAQGWWEAHNGEVDALLLPYIRTRNTTPLHAAIAWLLWLVRWVLGLSLVLGPLIAAANGVARKGIRLALRFVPLAVFAVALLAISQGLWRIVYWRPRALPPTSVEMVFVSAKLLLLYAAAMLMGAIVIHTYRRALRLQNTT